MASGKDESGLLPALEPLRTASRDDLAAALAAGLDRATSGSGDGLVELATGPGAAPRRVVARAEPSHGDVPLRGPLAGDGKLELDLSRAREKPADSAAAAPTGPSAGASMVVRAAPLAGARASAPSPGRERLLGDDRILAGLLAAGIGLAVGLLVATEATRRIERRELSPLHDELGQAIERPLAARAGEIRTAEAVRSDLKAAHDGLRGRFFGWWLGCGLALGTALFFAPRPRRS
jgi:hypothetical protein